MSQLSCSFIGSYGSLGSSPGQFHLPYGITSNTVSNIIYVSDCDNNRVVSFQSTSPNTMSVYGGTAAGSGKGQFNCPRLLVFDSQSAYLYVADGFNNRVVRFNPDKFESTFKSFGSTQSTCHSILSTPRGVAVDSKGRVWVTDTGNNRVIRFDPANYQSSCISFGSVGNGPGQFNYPYGIAVDEKGLVYVADANNRRIVQFDPANFLPSFTTFGSASSPVSIQFGTALRSLLYDSGSGYLYAGDASNNRIVRFRPSNFAGTFESFGTAGAGPGQFNYPYGVAFDSFGTAFVTDSNNNRVESFTCQGVSTNSRVPTAEPTFEPSQEASIGPIQVTSVPTLAYGASYSPSYLKTFAPSAPMISRYPSASPVSTLSKATSTSPDPLLALLALLVLVPLVCLCCCSLYKKIKYTGPEHDEEATGGDQEHTVAE